LQSAVDVTERPRYPIQVRPIRLPERVPTRACSLIADGRPASTPCRRSRGRQIWLQCRDTGRSVAAHQLALSARSGHLFAPDAPFGMTGSGAKPTLFVGQTEARQSLRIAELRGYECFECRLAARAAVSDGVEL